MNKLDYYSDDQSVSSKIHSMSGGDCIYLFPMDDGTIQLTFKKLCYGVNLFFTKEKEMFYCIDMYSTPIYVSMKMKEIIEELTNLVDDGPIFKIDRDTYMLIATKINKVKVPFDYKTATNNTSYIIIEDKVHEYYDEKVINSYDIKNPIEIIHKLVCDGFQCVTCSKGYFLKKKYD